MRRAAPQPSILPGHCLENLELRQKTVGTVVSALEERNLYAMKKAPDANSGYPKIPKAFQTPSASGRSIITDVHRRL